MARDELAAAGQAGPKARVHAVGYDPHPRRIDSVGGDQVSGDPIGPGDDQRRGARRVSGPRLDVGPELGADHRLELGAPPARLVDLGHERSARGRQVVMAAAQRHVGAAQTGTRRGDELGLRAQAAQHPVPHLAVPAGRGQREQMGGDGDPQAAHRSLPGIIAACRPFLPAPVRALAYENPRPEVQALVPRSASTILDLGCASGALGAALRARQPCAVTGVEADPAYAAQAEGDLTG